MAWLPSAPPLCSFDQNPAFYNGQCRKGRWFKKTSVVPKNDIHDGSPVDASRRPHSVLSGSIATACGNSSQTLGKDKSEKIHTLSGQEKNETPPPHFLKSTEVRSTEHTLTHVPRRSPSPRPGPEDQEAHVSSSTTFPHTPPSTQTTASFLLPFRAPQYAQ